MTLGAERTQTVVWQGDTAELFAYFYDTSDTPLAQAAYTSATFVIRKPDGTDVTAGGTINTDGSVFYRFTTTTLVGLYKWTAQATLTTGEKRTYRDEFQVEDPLTDPPDTWDKQIADEVWMRLEDCFDSENGGPWLRDMSLMYFEPSKIQRFVSEALLRINVTPPMTSLDLSTFLTTIPLTDPNVTAGTMQADPDRIIIVQGTLLAVIRHLMRSYTEQPNPQGANIVWQDRRDYLDRWERIFQIEEAVFKEMTLLWKRQFYNFGRGALLTHSKAGRLTPTGWRARNASRGYT